MSGKSDSPDRRTTISIFSNIPETTVTTKTETVPESEIIDEPKIEPKVQPVPEKVGNVPKNKGNAKNMDGKFKFKLNKFHIIIGVLVFSAIAWAIIAMNSESRFRNALTSEVRKGDLTVVVSEVGELVAQDQATISAINDKQILFLAEEGSYVHEGDTVVILESQKYVISSDEANSSVRVAQAEYEKAQNELEAQRAKEEAAKKNYETLPELAKKGFVVESEVEQARLEYLEMQSTTRSLESVVQARQADVDRARSNFRNQVRKLEESYILAPREGVVVYASYGSGAASRKVEVGMVPFEGMDLMYLPDVSTMQVKSELNEVDLDKVRIDQPVEIRLDAFPDTSFTGRVKNIGTLARRKVNPATGKTTGTKVFDLLVQVDGSDVRLKPGLSASINIIVSKQKDVVYIPIESVFTTDKNRKFVYMKEGNDIERRMIETGVSNDLYVEVKNGLEEDDIVLLDIPQE